MSIIVVTMNEGLMAHPSQRQPCQGLISHVVSREGSPSSELINVLAGTTFDLFATNGELEHDSAVLALLLADLGRGHFVHGLAPRALHLLGTRNELEHGPTVVADEMGAGHGRDPSRDRQLTIGEMHEQVLILVRDLVTLQHHCASNFCVSHSKSISFSS